MLLKNFLVCGNGILSAHAKPTNKEKLFLSMAKLQLSTAPKLTCSHKFHLRKPYCELAAKHPFFETAQSCVSSTASISHRFKAFSPPFCAKNRFRLVPSENSAKIFSDRALNRPRESRGPQPSISLKHGRLAHIRSQFSLFRRSPTHKNLPPATFCTSEQHSRR